MAYSPGDHQAVHFACFLDPESWGAGGVSAPPAAAGAEGRPPHPGYLLATGGVDHVKFWSAEGATLTGERGLWGPDAQCQPMLCGAGCGRLLLTGGVSGHVYVWRGRRVERTIRAHESLVTCLWADPKVGVLSGGGDGMVKLYSPKMEHQRSYGVAEAPAPPLLPAIKGLCGGLDRDGAAITKVLVATASSECFELATASGSWTLLGEGHFSDPDRDGASGELWGLAPHPTKADVFATGGDDGTVRVWSIGQGRLLRKVQLGAPTRCLTWHPNGRKLLVGLGGSARGLRQQKDGAFALLDADTLDVLYEGRDSRHWIRDAKFSPEGETFVLASQDQKLYLYDARQNVLRAKCDKHNDAVRERGGCVWPPCVWCVSFFFSFVHPRRLPAPARDLPVFLLLFLSPPPPPYLVRYCRCFTATSAMTGPSSSRTRRTRSTSTTPPRTAPTSSSRRSSRTSSGRPGPAPWAGPSRAAGPRS